MKCLDEERLFALADGAASDKDAKVWQQHVDGCERCAKALKTMRDALETIAVEEPLDVKAHADAVMASLDRAPAKRQRLLVPMGVSALALAAALLLGIGIGRGTKSNDEFTARGGASEPSLHRDVALDVLRRTESGFTRVAPNDEIAPGTAFAAEARNLGEAKACALVFLIDASGELRWLFPQYLEASENPSAVEIAPVKEPARLANGVTLAELAPGPATIVTMLTRAPMKVSQIEAMNHPTPDALRRAFPEADVRVLPIRVRP